MTTNTIEINETVSEESILEDVREQAGKSYVLIEKKRTVVEETEHKIASLRQQIDIYLRSVEKNERDLAKRREVLAEMEELFAQAIVARRAAQKVRAKHGELYGRFWNGSREDQTPELRAELDAVHAELAELDRVGWELEKNLNKRYYNH